MCGICGIIELSSKAADASLLIPMMKAIKHRGPDDEGVFSEEKVALGFVRLSIIDLSAAGHQPKVSDDGNYVMVFNGEIYNYIELRDELISEGVVFSTKTDTEVLLKAYIKWGETCLNRFNGMWAFVIYNRKDKSIFASRDRYGVKPFYYYLDNDRFIFASEIAAILSVLKKKATPDYQTIFDYLIFNRTDQTEATFFNGIFKLQHGNQLVINNGKVVIKKWYDLRSNLKQPFESAEEFRQLFSSAISLRLRSDVPVGVCLSGGLDSSSIVSTLLKDHDKQDLNTFSAVYEKGQFGDESEFIAEYRPQLNNMFFITPDADSLFKDLTQFIHAHGEPIPSTSPYIQYKVMELAKEHVVVTLDGQGADEALAGYHYFFGLFFKDLLLHGNARLLLKEIIAYIKNHRSLFGIKTFAFFLLPKKFRTMTRVSEKGYLQPSFVSKYGEHNTIAGNLYASKSLHDALLDHFEYKLEHLLKWEDRNSMWFSLESRVPFLDYRLVERTLALDGNDVIRDGTTKFILREAMRGILPEKIRTRQDKIGFDNPQAEWFRTPQFQKLITELLNSESVKNRGIIDPEKTKRLYAKHLNKQIDCSKEIWKWIHLELWFREFID
jgi:asparagine synthase (glutamine-hydrolysing)